MNLLFMYYIENIYRIYRKFHKYSFYAKRKSNENDKIKKSTYSNLGK